MTARHLLDQHTIVVTGVATGIGRAFAAGAAAQGANGAVVGPGPADETMASIICAGGQALCVQCDVSDDASSQAMARRALKRVGRIDGLVNNAAYFHEVKLTISEDIDPAPWERVFQVNVKGGWNCCKAATPATRERMSGSIDNVASVVALAGQPGYLHCVASKGAVPTMTKGLAKQAGQHGVRANVIAPGFVITDAAKNRPAGRQQSFLKARAISREQ